MVVANFGDPLHLNPIVKLGDPASGLAMWLIYNHMVTVNQDTRELLPDLATQWSRKDDLTWVVKLREGVQFHKEYGEFTAQDVEFNVNYTIETKAGRSFFYSFVKGAKAVDKYTVEYYLEQPFAPFPYITLPYFAGSMISKKAFDEMGRDTFGRNPVGTGPFVLESWKSGSDMIFKKNPKYWREGRPLLDEVVIKPVPDSYVRNAMLKTGEVDFVLRPDTQNLAEFRADKNFLVFSTPGWNWDYISFNLFDQTLPVAKKEVRQAISYAIDREAIVKNIYYGEAVPDDDPYPSGFLGADPDIQKYPNTADQAKARELLAQAGFPNGFSIKCITSDKDNLRREVQLVADQLGKVGVKVEIQGLDMGTFNTRIKEQKGWEMALEDIDIACADSDAGVYWFLRSGTTAWRGHIHPELDSLLDKGRSSFDEKERAGIYRRVTELVQDEAPYIYINHINYVRLAKKGLVGYVPGPQEDGTLGWQDVTWEK
jgi:peptide/nickel transport system substrate-binding protein